MPHLARLCIYPLKSFSPCEVREVAVLPTGALENDRRFAFVDGQGKFWNGKRTAAIHAWQATFDLAAPAITLSATGRAPQTFHLVDDRAALGAWASAIAGEPLELIEDAAYGWPDDTEANGPTVISTATLEMVCSWFPELSLESARLRFRANLEIGDCEAFWEDRLYPAADPSAAETAGVAFRVGAATYCGTNPCQRCVVPSRDPTTGEVLHAFAKRFGQFRAAALPDWAERSRFNHYYRLATNTRLARSNAGSRIAVGDAVEIGE